VQVVDCRRILKWTYAFGFYNFDESVVRDQTKITPEKLKQQQEFFEFNQVQTGTPLLSLLVHVARTLSTLWGTSRCAHAVLLGYSEGAIPFEDTVPKHLQAERYVPVPDQPKLLWVRVHPRRTPCRVPPSASRVPPSASRVPPSASSLDPDC